MKKKVYVFDFDGTLTTRDTLLEFIKYGKGRQAFLLGFLLYAPLLVLMKLGLYPNGKAKQRIFAHFFKGMSVDDFNTLCQRFADDNRSRLLRPKGEETLRQALKNGAMVLIVSASIDHWVKPFFSCYEMRSMPSAEHGIHILGTQLETSNGKLTGRFSTSNCYGREKVRRIENALPGSREEYEIIAFGDSRGDKEMLDFADKGYYKPFRR
ncbi:MAG: HAD family hydrolase [Prevotella sp.]|jgi:phosphatidylglycerophosphatase C